MDRSSKSKWIFVVTATNASLLIRSLIATLYLKKVPQSWRRIFNLNLSCIKNVSKFYPKNFMNKILSSSADVQTLNK